MRRNTLAVLRTSIHYNRVLVDFIRGVLWAVPLTASITKRNRRRRLKSGRWITQTRFVVNFHEPGTGKRRQFFLARHKDAIAKRDALLSSVVTGAYAETKSELTVAQAVGHWLESRRG